MSRHAGMSHAHPSAHRQDARVAFAEGMTLSSVLCLAANKDSPSRLVNQNVSAFSSKKRSIVTAIHARASRSQWSSNVD